MNIQQQQQQQGQYQQYQGNQQQPQDYYQQGDQGYLDTQQYDEYYQEEYLDDQGYQQGPGNQYPQQGYQQNQGQQYNQQGYQGNQGYYDDGQGYEDGQGYDDGQGYYEYGGESQQYHGGQNNVQHSQQNNVQNMSNNPSQQQESRNQNNPKQSQSQQQYQNNQQHQQNYQDYDDGYDQQYDGQYQPNNMQSRNNNPPQQQGSQGQRNNNKQSQQQNFQNYDDEYDQQYDQYQQNNSQNRNNNPSQNKNKQSQQQYQNYQQQQQNFQDYNDDDRFDQQYDQYQQGADPFGQFEDRSLDQGDDYGNQDQIKQDFMDSFDLKKEKSILNRIFQAKNPKHDLSKVKAMEALSEKHKNVNTWLHTTLANNPDMVTMNKFVQLGLVKSQPTAPQDPKPLNKGPRENPFKLETHTQVKLEDPKNFSEIKSFYYTNLFEDEVIDINNIVDKKKAEAALLIMQIGQRRLECDTITMKINTYKAPGLNQEKLQGGKDFIEYLMQHCRGQIASVFEKAPFSTDEILQELERQIPSNDEEGYFLLEKSKVELQKINFDALNQGNKRGDPIKLYKQDMDMKMRNGKKLLEVDHVDLRALKNRLNSTSICDFVGAYYAHEREGTLATFSEGIKKSLCSQHRADRFLYMIRLVKDLEINYLREQQKNPPVKSDKPLQYNRDSIYEKDIPLPISEPSTNADGKKEDITIYSFIPFWFVDWIDTSDRKSKILRDMLNVNLAIATKIYKLTSTLNLDEFIQYYRKHKGERELDIFTPQDAKALITLGWSLEMVEEFVEKISNLSEQAIALPKLLFDYGRAQPNMEILEVKGLQGLPLAAYSAIITSVLVHKNNIRGVRLNDLDLMPDSVPILQFLINNKDKKIMEVSLMNNHLKDEGSYRLLQFSKLDASHALKIIRLDRCGITSQGGIYISSLLKEAAYLQGSSLRLQILTLSGNTIGNSGVQTLLFALRTNTSLQYLDLSNNRVRDLPLTVVFDTLKQNKTLQILYLHENRFSDRAISQLFDDAEEYTNTSLLVLKLGTLRAIPDHIVKLIRLTLPSIKNLRYCEIFTPAGNRDVNRAIPLAIHTYPNPIILKVMDHQLEVGFHSLADLMIEIMYEKTKQDSSLNNKPVSPITGVEPNKNAKKGIIDIQLPFEFESVVKKLSEDFYGSATFECVCYLLETYLTYDMELKEGDSLIHRMAHHNQTEAVSYMLKLHANPDILTKPTFPGFPKATLLHIAVAINSLALIAEIILYGAKLDIRDANDNTPLHYAASLGQLELCSFLIEKGCSSDIKNKKRMEPLHASILSNDFEVLDFFIENRNPQKDRLAAKALLEAPVSRGYSCAHLAIENNSVDIFHHLIKYEVDLNLQDASKKTPLHLAIELDNSEIIETLLSQKVNLNLKDSHGETPIFYACKKGNLELAQNLYNLGAQLNIQTAKGDILLHFAAGSDNVELIYWLLGRGLNPSKKNLFGQAPRDLARSKVIRDLLPVQSELPQFDIYGNNARISGRELEEKVLLREPSSRKEISRSATIFTNSQGDNLEEEDDEDYEEGDEDEEGEDGESEYEYEYEYEDEVEGEPARPRGVSNNRGQNRQNGQSGQNAKQVKQYDDDYEDSELDSEENSPTAMGGRSRNATQTRKRTLSKNPGAPQQNPMIPKVPSYQNNTRVGGENSPAVSLAGGGVAKSRALTPVKQNNVPSNKRLSQDYTPNKLNNSLNRSYLGNNGYDMNKRSGGENTNGNKSMIINSNERGGTPAKERLPPLRSNSIRPSYKGGNPFTEQEIAGTRNVGNHSYLNYLEEVAGKKEKEDVSRDYKLPIIKKEYS